MGDADFDAGDTTVQAVIAAGETVTCVFTNTQRGTIIVDKVTDPSGSPQLFTFDPSWGADFQLADATTPHDSGFLTPGTYSVSETVPAGWDLTSTVCTSSIEGTEAADEIDLDPGETVTCVFTNTQRGTIIVEKQTNPADSPQTFTFTGDAAGSIADNGQIVVGNLVPGTYTSTEAVTPDWVLDSIVCDDGQSQNPSSGSLVDRKATFKLDAGETVKCTFTNLFAKLSVVKSASPAFYSKAGDLITYTVTTTNVGAATLTNVGVSDPLIPQLASWACTVDGAAVTLPVASLAPGKAIVCKATYTVTQADVDNANKSIPNTACAISAQTSKPVCDDERVYESELSIVKTSNVQTYDAVGDVITYTVKATNIGNYPLTNVVVTDKLLTVKLDNFVCSPTVPVASLAPGASITCTGSHTITQADLDKGDVLNTACADSDQTPEVCDDLDIPAIKLAVVKTADTPIADIEGEDVTFTFTVTNTSKVPVSIVSLVDSDFGALQGDADCQVGVTLPAGASCQFEATFFVEPEVVADPPQDTIPHVNTFTACAVAGPSQSQSDRVCAEDDEEIGWIGGAGGGGGGGGQPPTDTLIPTDTVSAASGPLDSPMNWILIDPDVGHGHPVRGLGHPEGPHLRDLASIHRDTPDGRAPTRDPAVGFSGPRWRA